MAIAFECPACQSKFRVNDDRAGKRGKCPKCQSIVVVPGPSSIPDSPSVSAPITNSSPVSQPAENTYRVEMSPQDTPRLSQPTVAADTTEKKSKAPQDSPTREGKANRPTSKKELSKRFSDILGGFDGSFIKPRPTGFHLLAGLFVSLIVLCLPVVYLGIVAGFGYATYYHATEHAWLVTGAGEVTRSGRAMIFAVVIYLIPVFAGITAVFFLLKPFFAPKIRPRPAVLIHEADEPLVWAFVRKVCESVGAPIPKQIAINTDANAFAGFRNGMWSLFGNDLRLTIGLSLAGGLTLNQFAGVLAHEFGHFSQRYSMRVNYVLQNMQAWFFRIAYERDSWDAFLADLTHEEEHWSIMLFGVLARFFVFLSRLILKAFAFTSLVLSRWLLRQMEFDADRYEANLVGSKVFEETSSRIELLAFGDTAAIQLCRQAVEHGKLPNNYPALVQALAEHISDEDWKVIRKAIRQRENSIFDTHPSTKERIASARKVTTDPIFRCSGAASDLFRDFDLLSHETSFDLYRSSFNAKQLRNMLRPTAEFVPSK